MEPSQPAATRTTGGTVAFVSLMSGSLLPRIRRQRPRRLEASLSVPGPGGTQAFRVVLLNADPAGIPDDLVLFAARSACEFDDEVLASILKRWFPTPSVGAQVFSLLSKHPSVDLRMEAASGVPPLALPLQSEHLYEVLADFVANEPAYEVLQTLLPRLANIDPVPQSLRVAARSRLMDPDLRDLYPLLMPLAGLRDVLGLEPAPAPAPLPSPEEAVALLLSLLSTWDSLDSAMVSRAFSKARRLATVSLSDSSEFELVEALLSCPPLLSAFLSARATLTERSVELLLSFILETIKSVSGVLLDASELTYGLEDMWERATTPPDEGDRPLDGTPARLVFLKELAASSLLSPQALVLASRDLTAAHIMALSELIQGFCFRPYLRGPLASNPMEVPNPPSSSLRSEVTPHLLPLLSTLGDLVAVAAEYDHLETTRSYQVPMSSSILSLWGRLLFASGDSSSNVPNGYRLLDALRAQLDESLEDLIAFAREARIAGDIPGMLVALSFGDVHIVLELLRSSPSQKWQPAEVATLVFNRELWSLLTTDVALSYKALPETERAKVDEDLLVICSSLSPSAGYGFSSVIASSLLELTGSKTRTRPSYIKTPGEDAILARFELVDVSCEDVRKALLGAQMETSARLASHWWDVFGPSLLLWNQHMELLRYFDGTLGQLELVHDDIHQGGVR